MQTAVPFRQVNVNIEKTTNEVTKRIAHLLYEAHKAAAAFREEN
ncbi:unnamed protein product [Brassica napus]|uniref:(rape) hypothetical protein n=1 Tax=Brassica napus TaxID=3708 RepID=A0A816TVN8_BRANA|nr:unnamed protein product [Brassica napus]